MPTVAAHCHASRIWYEPVETLLFQMDRDNVDAAILIQMVGQTDNAYQQECLARFPGRFASVVIVDAQKPDAAEQLRKLKSEGASGVRLRATTRSPGADPLEIWHAAAELRLSVSCPGTSADFASEAFAHLAPELRNATLLAEHLPPPTRPPTPTPHPP